jgi:hypothetical protein
MSDPDSPSSKRLKSTPPGSPEGSPPSTPRGAIGGPKVGGSAMGGSAMGGSAMGGSAMNNSITGIVGVFATAVGVGATLLSNTIVSNRPSILNPTPSNSIGGGSAMGRSMGNSTSPSFDYDGFKDYVDSLPDTPNNRKLKFLLALYREDLSVLASTCTPDGHLKRNDLADAEDLYVFTQYPSIDYIEQCAKSKGLDSLATVQIFLRKITHNGVEYNLKEILEKYPDLIHWIKSSLIECSLNTINPEMMQELVDRFAEVSETYPRVSKLRVNVAEMCCNSDGTPSPIADSRILDSEYKHGETEGFNAFDKSVIQMFTNADRTPIIQVTGTLFGAFKAETVIMEAIYNTIIRYLERIVNGKSYYQSLYEILLRMVISKNKFIECNENSKGSRSPMSFAFFAGRRTFSKLSLLFQNYLLDKLIPTYIGSSSITYWYIASKLLPKQQPKLPVGTHSHNGQIITKAWVDQVDPDLDLKEGLPFSPLYSHILYHLLCTENNGSPMKTPMLPDLIGIIPFLILASIVTTQSGQTLLEYLFSSCRHDSGNPDNTVEFLRRVGLSIPVMHSEMSSDTTLTQAFLNPGITIIATGGWGGDSVSAHPESGTTGATISMACKVSKIEFINQVSGSTDINYCFKLGDDGVGKVCCDNNLTADERAELIGPTIADKERAEAIFRAYNPETHPVFRDYLISVYSEIIIGQINREFWEKFESLFGLSRL